MSADREKIIADAVKEGVEEAFRRFVVRPEGVEKLVGGSTNTARHGLAGAMVRALAVAHRTGRDPVTVAQALRMPQVVVRALGESLASAGGVLVPEEVSREVLQELQSQAVIRRAGARVLPMRSDTLHLGRITSSATAAWVGEGQDIVASQPSFEAIVFTAKKLAALVPISNELLEDAGPDVDALIQAHLARIMAAQEDVAFLRADGTQYQPKGIRYWTHSNNIFAANATVNVTNVVADLTKAVELLHSGLRGNVTRPAWAMAPRSFVYLLRLRDTAGWVFPSLNANPPTLLGYPVFVTDQIPTNLGASSDESEVFLFDANACLIAQREGLVLSVSPDAAYIENNTLVSAFARDQVVVRATLRVDFALAYPRAAAIITAVKWI